MVRSSTTPMSQAARDLLRTIVALISMLWLVLLVSGCQPSSSSSVNRGSAGDVEDNSPIRIVATTGMIGDMVSQLIGGEATVESIMGTGVDPHLYQPTRGDSIKLDEADIVIYNGLHLEGRMTDVMKRRETNADKVTIAVGETLPHDKLLEADAGTHDPHVWLDVQLWGQATANVADQLIAAMPDHADEIRQRAETYQTQLAALDQWGSTAIQSVPENQRVMITSHDAFQYFGKRYGVEVHGVQGVSTASTPGIEDVLGLVKLVVEKQVPAIFFESSVPEKQLRAIVEGAQQQGHNVSSGFTLYSDSMGASDSPAGNYIGMMSHNFRTIVEALGGQAGEFELEASDMATASTTSLADGAES